ncbi:MAG: hypothetical protein OXP75_16450, partial [Rhodospirillales bacterium]|nr:hypothetical protein [Rhodospirillales bacterium]
CSGLQIRVRRFDSGLGLQLRREFGSASGSVATSAQRSPGAARHASLASDPDSAAGFVRLVVKAAMYVQRGWPE